MKKKVKVALGLSGGVDSAVCAHLLIQQGYDVTAVFIECWNEPGCRTDQDHKDALQIALALKIPFKVLDLRKAYKEKVMAYFLSEYKYGRTPNPDVICNREIKFGLFYDWAIKAGFDKIATGHYAKILEIGGAKQLVIPKDTHKDQTYFLHLLRQKQLDSIIFPLAELTKVEVRQKAKEWGIAVADKKDSVGICFVGDINVHQFIKKQLGENPGEVVDHSGNIIGKHKGVWFYTIGQRGGFTINPTSLTKTKTGEVIKKENIPPFYVIGKIVSKNQLMVGFGAQTQQTMFFIKDSHLIDQSIDLIKTESLFVRIRHTGELIPCSIKKLVKLRSNKKNASLTNKSGINKQSELSDLKLRVKLSRPGAGLAPGQSAVFYQKIKTKIVCLGGGIIS